MSWGIFLLFFNAILTTAVSAAIVIGILRREYLPVIRRLEAEEAEGAPASSQEPGSEAEVR